MKVIYNNIPNENKAVLSLPDYKMEIVKILHSNLTPKHMRERIIAYHENDIATALELLNASDRMKLYRLLDAETLASVLEYSERAWQYISELNIRKKVDVLSKLETNAATEVLRNIGREERATLLELLEPELQEKILLLCSFDEDGIGSVMSTNYVAVPSGCGVCDAMRELISQAADNDNISTIYVVDEKQTFVGAIDLKDLIIARESTPIEDITTTSYPYVYTGELIDDCVERLRDYSEDSIPVLDSDNRLKGVLTSPVLADLLGDIMGEDYARLGGLSAEEDLQEPIKRSIAKRLPWLIILLGLGLLVSGVVGIFEQVVAQLAIIVSFQSLVLDMAGNVGTQSLAVTIRVLMDEQVDTRRKLFLIGKEARVGILNGLILGTLSFLLIGAYLSLVKTQPVIFAFSVSFCTGAALLLSIILSSISGTVVPIIFNKLGVDPAVASGPLITTINDLVAVISYYGLAWVLLLNVLHL